MPIAPNEQILAADVVSTATANKIALRDAAARTKFAAPSAADDAAILSTVTDHAALTSPHSAVSAATASRLVVRDAAGRAKFVAGAAAGDALIFEQLGAKATSGQYTGNGTANRAIAHGLGVTPKVVLIGGWAIAEAHQIFGAVASIMRMTDTSTLAVTIPDSTNFYVGNATNYVYSANNDTVVYDWVAIG